MRPRRQSNFSLCRCSEVTVKTVALTSKHRLPGHTSLSGSPWQGDHSTRGRHCVELTGLAQAPSSRETSSFQSPLPPQVIQILPDFQLKSHLLQEAFTERPLTLPSLNFYCSCKGLITHPSFRNKVPRCFPGSPGMYLGRMDYSCPCLFHE